MGTYSKKTHGSFNHSLAIIITVCQTTLQEGLPFHTTSNPKPVSVTVSTGPFGSVWVHGAARQVRALSEELENPMNVHRWRKLEGSDPVMYELIQKARPPVQCRAGFQRWENAKPTRFCQKKREEGTNKKKWKYKNKSWGIFSLVPLISTLFSNVSLVSCSQFFRLMIGKSFAKLQGIFSAGMQKSDHQDDMKHLFFLFIGHLEPNVELRLLYRVGGRSSNT